MGSGARPLVVLHGFLGSGRNLGALARLLTEGDPSLSVFVLDLTGHGASPPLPDDADLSTLAEDVMATTADLGLLAPIGLVGHSLGGRVGLRMAVGDPVMLSYLATLDISPSPTPASTGDVPRVLEALARAPERAPSRESFRRALLEQGLSPEVVEWLLLNLERDGDAHRWRIDRRALAALHARVVAEDLWPAVERSRPYGVHLIRGGRSTYVSDADAGRLQRADCRVDTVPEAGHWLHTERPAEVASLILSGLPVR